MTEIINHSRSTALEWSVKTSVYRGWTFAQDPQRGRPPASHINGFLWNLAVIPLIRSFASRCFTRFEAMMCSITLHKIQWKGRYSTVGSRICHLSEEWFTLADVQSLGTVPFWRNIWNRIFNMGVSSFLSSFSTFRFNPAHMSNTVIYGNVEF